MHSAIYEGTVRHRRHRPCVNTFRYGLFMLYADLDELESAFRAPGWSTRGFNLAWFRRADYMKSQRAPGLADAVRDLVQERTGVRPAGPIRMLTHFRYFGFGMNPVSFYYCFEPDGERVACVLAEINNTPWGEQFTYVLPRAAGVERTARGGAQAFRFEKQFHVSPFMPMDQQYRWRFGTPGPRLAVHMENHDAAGRIFDATLVLRRREITPARLSGLLLRYPMMTLQVVGRIYAQAVKLWWKGAPFFAHPKHSSQESNAHADRTRIRLDAGPAAEPDAAAVAGAAAPLAAVAAVGAEARAGDHP